METIHDRGMFNPVSLARHIGVSRAQLYQMMATGRVPQPLRLSERVIRWPAEMVRQWESEGCPVDWAPRTKAR